ncbi:DUF4064 domain-containing protein [Terribacillus saccharophilus]|uniref:DUF4064 domain-containing protein n=1 Tax=Terribacillus saccharophilus TaxID=361277 RepID=A0A268A850_9BACI|nr:DUF4064 domain-containing protein [Terribacillus saccharophilus]PAD20298.1 hypothetical protein CHH64_14525 [Terribacillus saccharophilus]PAF18262.1 hypothetical protein CHH51_08185 [Terribacillus saccharophilus]PAF35846.1 hypothetical protein CHH58_14760 [Terribacillus saccharophilus]
MVKRTTEKVLAIIGAVLFLIFAVWSGIGLGGADEATTNELVNQGLTQEDASMFTDLVTGMSIWFIILYVICAILGFVSLVMLKPNKKATGAGILLIITAVLGTILSVFTGIIGGILYLIAGIMAIVRKPVEQYNDRGETY